MTVIRITQRNMKRILTYISIVVLATTIGCDSDKDRIVFDPDNGQTLISFNESSGSLAILINDIGQLEVVVNSSTRATSDRMFSLSVGEGTTASPDYFNLPPAVVIPANAFQGSFVIDGIDPIGEQIPLETLVVNIDAPEGAVVSGSLTVSVFITCPVANEFFLGDYLVEQLTPSIFGYDTFDPDGGGVVLTLSNPSDADGVEIVGSTMRVFEADYIAVLAFGNTFEYTVDFVCEQVVFAADQFTGLQCTSGVSLGPAVGENGTYNSLDDSSFVLIFQDDVTDDCGQGAPDVSLSWSKQ